MNTCKISLRALSHPVTLTSIILLLLNDHVFKNVAPSLLTGKLSDFAGLFFFPFLLAFLLGLLFDWHRVPTRHLAISAFTITLFWFMAIKVWPFANNQTALLVSQVLGFPTQIVLDPSDLLALIVLWPAWQLWLYVERQPSALPNRVAYLALGLASLATLATQPCPPQARILRLVTDQQSIYTKPFYDGYGHAGNPSTEILVSDTGQNWKPIEQGDISTEIAAKLQETLQLPVMICDLADPTICFRVLQSDQVEGSTDGGNTWETIWRLPWGRRYYMERHLSSTWLSCKQTPDQGPYDLALLSKEGQRTLIAAMGNEGVLVLLPEGNWERYEASNAAPTPYSAWEIPLFLTTPLNALLVLLIETGLGVVLAMLLWLIWSVRGIRLVLKTIDSPTKQVMREATAPFVYGFFGFLGSLALFGVLLFWAHTEILLLLPIAIMSLAIGSIFAWGRAIQRSNRPDLARRVFGTTLLSSLGIYPLAWLPFVAWIYGLIPLYELALGLALTIAAISFLWQTRTTKRLKKILATRQF